MAPVTLPPSFYNSFWSPEYRTGLDVLFKQLHQGCLEDEDIVDFISSQVNAHHILSKTLLEPPPSHTPANSSSSSSLQHTLLSLRGASSARGEAHRALAIELDQRVLAGFKIWKERHEERVGGAREEFLGKGGVVGGWEKEVQKLSGLKQAYLTKSRAADDSEDDAKFAPATAQPPPPDTYTASPRMKNANALLKRSGTVADRISEKLRQASISSSTSSSHRSHTSIEGKVLPAPPTPLESRSSTPVQGEKQFVDSPSSPTREDSFVPPTDPFSLPSVSRSGPPLPSKSGGGPNAKDDTNQPILLSGLSFSLGGLRELQKRFDTYLISNLAAGVDIEPDQYPTKSKAALASRQRSTILGTYEKTFSGEEIVEWLRTNVEGFGGDWDRCVDAADELYDSSYISRIGVGRGFEPSSDTHYVLKVGPSSEPSSSTNGGSANGLNSPNTPSSTNTSFSMLKQYLPAALGNSDEPAHVRLRRDAVKADEAYKEGVSVVEDKRLDMEERIERGLRVWERWERERLSAVRTVLKQYEEALSRLPSRLGDIQPSTALSVEAFNPDADLKALIEGNRTGPFKPRPTIYESLETDVPEVNFGIDLRRWAGDQGWKAVKTPSRPKGSIPEVLDGLLKGLEGMYQEIPEDERRKAWLYEVPLVEVHGLRHAINNPIMTVEEIAVTVQRFNVPVAAGVMKLWLLELNPPIMGWEGWEDAKAIYPSDQERDMTSAVTAVLGRLPGSQLYVLDAVIRHFRDLVDATKTDEPNEVYITKLSLSLGRNILRPQYDDNLTIGDRTPSLFLADLITLYHQIFPSLVDKKKKEADRVMPIRKRTALVDQRISRSRLSGETNPQELLEAQRAMQNPRSRFAGGGASNEEPPVPKIPELPALTSLGTGSLGLHHHQGGIELRDDGPPKFQEPKDEDEGDRSRSYRPSPTQAPASAEAARPVPIVQQQQMQQQQQQSQTSGPNSRPTSRPASRHSMITPNSSASANADGPPSFVDPDSSDREDDYNYNYSGNGNDNDNDNDDGGAEYRTPVGAGDGSGSGHVTDDDSATAQYLSSIDQNPEDAPIQGVAATVLGRSGSGGLKRAGSGEAGRLRGPRGARGPRPAPGGARMSSYSASGPPAA